MHMVRAMTGTYELPLKINGTFDIALCLSCHAGAPSFRAVEPHQSPDLQETLLDHSMRCTGMCHPAAHPEEALRGGEAAS
jgi:hypothetical protein